MKRYYIGRYNPCGNHFFAFVIKDSVVKWLEPKPLAYRDGAETIPAVVCASGLSGRDLIRLAPQPCGHGWLCMSDGSEAA